MSSLPTDSQFDKTPVEVAGIPVVSVDNNPLQVPGKHRKVRVVTLGGPEDRGDRRLYLHQQELEKWLEMCKHSLTRRVQMDSVGIRIITWHDARSGHTYQTFEFVHRPAKAESPSAVARFGISG